MQNGLQILEHLKASKEKSNKILSFFFADKIKSDDVAELVHTSQKLDTILSKIISRQIFDKLDTTSLSFRIFQRSLEKLDSILGNYYDSLAQLDAAGLLARSLGNSNQRRVIDQHNSTLLIETSNLDEKHEYLTREAEKGLDYRRASTYLTTSIDGNKVGTILNQGEDLKLDDADAKKMWESSIGTKVMAEWDKFISSLGASLGAKVTDDQRKALKHILDNSNTGFVSSFKFNEFLKGFGPLKLCLQNVSKILSESWFHGFLSLEEAKKFLEREEVGTFLMRFSSSRPGAFALAFTSAPNQVTHVMITTCVINGERGFSIAEGDQQKFFPADVRQIVKYYSSLLTIPFESTLPEEAWFHGDISANEAEEKLAGKKAGTFIIRFSSQPGHLAGSYVDTSGAVGKCLIATTPGFYIADQESMRFGQFATMRELIAQFNITFKYPYMRTTNEVANALRTKIATEILDTERSYVKALSAVSTVFLTPLYTNPKAPIAKEETNSIFSNIAQLLEVHSTFLSKLQAAMSSWSPEDTELAPLLVDLNKQLTCYTTYINNYNAAMDTLNKSLTKKPDFKKFLDAGLAKPECDQANITAYLIQPVQRIPRYILLLSDLLKHTGEGHVDHEGLERALTNIKSTADYINESKRISENTAKLTAIQASVEGLTQNIVSNARKFVKEGDVTEKTKGRHLFLLSDMLVVTKAKKEKLVLKTIIDLPTIDPSTISPVPESKTDKNAFKIGATILSTATPIERDRWVTDLRKALEPPKNDDVSEAQNMRNQRMSMMSSPKVAHLAEPRRAASVGAFQNTPPSSPGVNRTGIASPQLNRVASANAVSSAPNSPQLQRTGSADAVPGEWKEAAAPDGRKYYYNTVTRVTSWTKPY